jgi:hypothetical protein
MTANPSFVALAVCAIAAGCATTSPPQDFPAEAKVIKAPALTDRLSGRAYTAHPSNGKVWKMNFGTDGRFNITTGEGQSDKGRWRVEDSRLCVEYEGQFPSGCSEMRAGDKMLYLKRSSTGEVVAFEATP